jgi:hypothetical protein
MSPSRLMAIMDPLLNTGFLWRCLAAYAGIKADDEPPHDDLESATVADLNKSSIQSSPDQMVPDLDDNKQNLKQSEYIRGDKYYSQLGIFKKNSNLLKNIDYSSLISQVILWVHVKHISFENYVNQPYPIIPICLHYALQMKLYDNFLQPI